MQRYEQKTEPPSDSEIILNKVRKVYKKLYPLGLTSDGAKVVTFAETEKKLLLHRVNIYNRVGMSGKEITFHRQRSYVSPAKKLRFTGKEITFH